MILTIYLIGCFIALCFIIFLNWVDGDVNLKHVPAMIFIIALSWFGILACYHAIKKDKDMCGKLSKLFDRTLWKRKGNLSLPGFSNDYKNLKVFIQTLDEKYPTIYEETEDNQMEEMDGMEREEEWDKVRYKWTMMRKAVGLNKPE